MTILRQVGAYVTALLKNTSSLLSGCVGIGLTVGVTYFPPNDNGQIALKIATAFALFLATFLVWRKEYAERQRLEGVFNSLPQLVIADNAFEESTFYMGNPEAEYSSLRLRVINNCEGFGVSEAKSVGAHLKIFDSQGQLRYEFQGRWSDTPQPPSWDPTKDKVTSITEQHFRLDKNAISISYSKSLMSIFAIALTTRAIIFYDSSIVISALENLHAR